MTNWVLMTSGINDAYGVYTPDQRLHQTILSADKTRNNIPNANIILVEAGVTTLTIAQQELLKPHFDGFIDYTGHPTIQFAHQTETKNAIKSGGAVKTICELFIMKEALKQLPIKDDDRIFKMTGRYRPSPFFNVNEHLSRKGKYLFKDAQEGFMFYRHDGTQFQYEYQYKTRLYSFCGSIIKEVIEDFETMFSRTVEMYSLDNYIDVEHATYKFIDRSKVETVPVIGVEGNPAPDFSILME